jgi:hypothetical protein
VWKNPHGRAPRQVEIQVSPMPALLAIGKVSDILPKPRVRSARNGIRRREIVKSDLSSDLVASVQESYTPPLFPPHLLA